MYGLQQSLGGTIVRKTGDEPILWKGKETGFCLRDFWSWSYSDLLDNTLRGCYSEFIVAAALGIDLSEPRANWEPWDLTLYEEANAIHIEVKSGSYPQAWKQNHPSTIRFGIQPTICWSPTNGYTGEPHRQSDVYVFCVFAEQDAAKADPMKLDSWEFYVLPTKELDKHCGVQRTISLNALLRLSPQKVDFADLKSAVLQSV